MSCFTVIFNDRHLNVNWKSYLITNRNNNTKNRCKTYVSRRLFLTCRNWAHDPKQKVHALRYCELGRRFMYKRYSACEQQKYSCDYISIGISVLFSKMVHSRGQKAIWQSWNRIVVCIPTKHGRCSFALRKQYASRLDLRGPKT